MARRANAARALDERVLLPAAGEGPALEAARDLEGVGQRARRGLLVGVERIERAREGELPAPLDHDAGRAGEADRGRRHRQREIRRRRRPSGRW